MPRFRSARAVRAVRRETTALGGHALAGDSQLIPRGAAVNLSARSLGPICVALRTFLTYLFQEGTFRRDLSATGGLQAPDLPHLRNPSFHRRGGYGPDSGRN